MFILFPVLIIWYVIAPVLAINFSAGEICPLVAPQAVPQYPTAILILAKVVGRIRRTQGNLAHTLPTLCAP